MLRPLLQPVTHEVAGSIPVVPASNSERLPMSSLPGAPRSRGVFAQFVAILSTLAAVAPASRAREPQRQDYIMYVGTQTGKESKGIYAFRYDAKSGEATSLGLAAETKNPTFLTIHPNSRFLYAVNAIVVLDPGGSGAVSAFEIDGASGRLTFLNQVSARGGGPCYITVDRKGRNALVANYVGGSVTVLPLAKDGRLREASAFVQHAGSSADPARQEGPHAHSIDLSPDQRFALTADLGLDKILIYRFDSEHGSLTANHLPFVKLRAKSGPRHLAFHPNGHFVYVINELASQITVFSYDKRAGIMNEIQSLPTLPEGFEGENYPAEIAIHPSGRFVYGSNRGHDSIAVFSVDSGTGKLTLVETVLTGGRWPRHFEIDPTSRFLFGANENSSDIRTFRIDPQTGRLSPTGQVLQVPSPDCIKFVPVR